MSKFVESIAYDEDLKRAAKVAIEDVMAVKEGENVLIVSNPDDDVRRISEVVFNASVDSGGKTSLVFQEPKTQVDFAEDAVIRAIESNPDVFISISRHKLGKDRFRMKDPISEGGKEFDHIFTYLWKTKKLRSFWSPSITAKMFIETVPIDYGELRSNARKLKGILDKADAVHITAKAGTDVRIGLKGRTTHLDDGDFTKPGTGGNLPAGEVYISPELESSEGTIVYDGSISAHKGVIIILDPIKVKVESNSVTKIEGGTEATALENTLNISKKTALEMAEKGSMTKEKSEEYIKGARCLGELGIGLNKKAEIVGNMLEDEKVYGTCHIAIGSNYDEDVKSFTHLDGLVWSPTITAIHPDDSEETIMKDGKLV
ncbi:MAG: aminopeptidase [Thermoplasmata archaeon]|nr:aminopeptidase [Thermoplasmata archaeon]